MQGGYVRDYEVIALCEGRQDGRVLLSQRNRFFQGDEADVLEPGKKPYTVRLDAILDEAGEPIQAAPHATSRVLWETQVPIQPGAILRRRTSRE